MEKILKKIVGVWIALLVIGLILMLLAPGAGLVFGLGILMTPIVMIAVSYWLLSKAIENGIQRGLKTETETETKIE